MGSEAVLVAAVFLASAVEMVEALTIVLAVGSSRGWRSSLEGVVAALIVLAALVIVLGPALVGYIPLNLLRSVVGGVLLIFGLQWLRKAVLRAAGLKAKRDEDLVYRSTIATLSSANASGGSDLQGFVVAFKGVFIEGLEVVIIVLTMGSSTHELALASVSAVAAAVVVAVVGLAVARQLSGVPENAMKLIVGVMLISFGTFWGGEGLGIRWPGSDLAIPALVLVYGALTFLVVKAIESLQGVRLVGAKVEAEASIDFSSPSENLVDVRPRKAMPVRLAGGFFGFWWEFLVGDTPELFAGTLAIFGATEFLLHSQAPALVLVLSAPSLVVVLLGVTVATAYRSSTRR